LKEGKNRRIKRIEPPTRSLKAQKLIDGQGREEAEEVKELEKAGRLAEKGMASRG
jgi:hypothetical protein